VNDLWQDRLHLSVKKKFHSVSNMASKMGVSKTFFGRYIKEEKPPVRALLLLEKAGINPEYIKNGTLPIFLNEDEVQGNSAYGFKKVPLYDIGATGGDVHLFNDDNEAPIETISLPANSGDRAILVHGDSMHPVYSNGDIITIERPSTDILFGKAYLVICENQRMIKYLMPAENDKKIICKSENPIGNPEFEIYKKDIIKLFLIRSCLKNIIS